MNKAVVSNLPDTKVRYAEAMASANPAFIITFTDAPTDPENILAQLPDLSETPNTLTQRQDFWAFGTYVKESFNSVAATDDYKQTSLELAQDNFSRALLGSFEQEPIEDGYSHPSEKLMEAALMTHESIAENWIQPVYLKNIKSRPTISAGILRCMGRLNKNLTTKWGLIMVIVGLASPDVELREAAIITLETWGDNESLEILQTQVEREKENWLKNYIEQVITDLSE